RDPELSESGEKRSIRLAEILENVDLDAIYSTNYKRTQGTVKHVATAKSVDVQLYNPGNNSQLDEIFETNRGKTILICGHSNSIPMTVNFYLDDERFDKFDESDYENLIILTLKDKGDASIVHLKY